MGNAYIMLVGKPEGKRPLGRPRRRWKDNIAILKGRGHVGNVGVNDSIILECIFGINDMKLGTELNWLRIESNGGLVWT
jgi:hypothetical protein